jgi:hypothetical protein
MSLTTPIEPKVALRQYELPESKMPEGRIVVFICPTPGCGNHYAAPSFDPDDPTLSEVQHRRNEDGERQETRSRIDCPDCYLLRNERVPRVPHIVTGVITLDTLMVAVAKHHDHVEIEQPMAQGA